MTSFLPWMRRGVVQSLATNADADGVPSAGLGELEAAVTIGSTEVSRTLRVRGPGSVIGLAPTQIVRRDPLPGTSDFDASYFPAIELLSPDLPWMFTPAAASVAPDRKLMPWLVLVVVEDRAGVTLGVRAGAPLEVLAIDDAKRELPALREAWAWAHVQATTSLDAGVEAAFAACPEAFVARLLCARRLEAGKRYIACVVPSFEPGVLAGLGRTSDPAAELRLAWADDTEAVELPVYCSWRFGTSAEPADFEMLVKRLVARPLTGLGVHAMDIGDPGSTRLPLAPGTMVEMRGALIAPELAAGTWDTSHKREFQRSLRQLLDESLAASADPDPYDAGRDDPVVAPPVYGALPARIDHVPAPEGSPAWMAEANLDPVHRSAAGLGAEVIRRNQEQLAAEIWDQVGALRQVNRTLGRARLALEVGTRIQSRFATLDDGALLQLSRPVHTRLKGAGMDQTLHGRLADSALPAGLISGAFRRKTRSTTVMRAVARTSGAAELSARLTTAFVKDPAEMLEFAQFTVPYRTVFTDESQAVKTAEPVAVQLRAIHLDAVIGVGTGGAIVREPAMRSVTTRLGLAIEGRAAPATSVASNPIVLTNTVPVAIDAADAGALELGDAAALVRDKLDPAAVLRVRVRSLVTAPATAWTADVPARMQATPQLHVPAYELLCRISPELLCPGVSELATDTVGLATVNAAFVEAFLLGANHELARELVWREVPVDPSDTWMRTFWDPVTGTAGDIARVASWESTPLGTHKSRRAPDPDQVLVLVVKSELLRRYPNTLIYAVRAAWSEHEGVDERIESTEVVQPSFVGALGPDVVFLGFAFDAPDVAADVIGSPVRSDGRAGWFFAFEQPPTEPRFGLDVGDASEAGTVPALWKDVSWFHALGDAASTATHVPLTRMASVSRPYDTIGENVWSDTWARDAVAIARITLQRPVRMLVHGDQMLPAADGDEA